MYTIYTLFVYIYLLLSGSQMFSGSDFWSEPQVRALLISALKILFESALAIAMDSDVSKADNATPSGSQTHPTSGTSESTSTKTNQRRRLQQQALDMLEGNINHTYMIYGSLIVDLFFFFFETLPMTHTHTHIDYFQKVNQNPNYAEREALLKNIKVQRSQFRQKC